jgi:hypothetical protein
MGRRANIDIGRDILDGRPAIRPRALFSLSFRLAFLVFASPSCSTTRLISTSDTFAGHQTTTRTAVMLCDSHSPCLDATAPETLAGNPSSQLLAPYLVCHRPSTLPRLLPSTLHPNLSLSYSWDRHHAWPQNGIREAPFSGFEATAPVWPRLAFD